VADLGTSEPAASVKDLSNATYSGSLPETDIYICGSYYRPDQLPGHDPSYVEESYPLTYGATWGVRFGDGSQVLV
jgi:hypothetical protein